MILAQTQTDPSFMSNQTLDKWEIPFGDWMDQAVDWIAVNLQGLLRVIEWPFDTLIDAVVRNFLVDISWVWVVLGFALIATLVRNIKVGIFVAGALFVCGILGNGYWLETARTIGFIGVAVFLCVLIGIPVGIAAGRLDGVWQVTRPILDAMQVVHSFVYMLPFIFFWGIGEVSATMVTMIFAVPPLIRLTNLGIRQVPGDVVEAARAQGAPEWRVLLDVQLPLARPAIMTGINQTLLLAISMLGIAAIMGAGGLGTTLFRALSNQDVALAFSSGLAFFLVAVVLDRMSQREDTDQGNLFQRIRQAWAHRRDPEALLPEEGGVAGVRTLERYEPIRPMERVAMLVAGLGGLVAATSVFLPWSIDSGKITAYGVRVDEDLTGMSLNGLDPSGGSFFGIVVLVLGLFALGAALNTFLRPGRGGRWLTADGAVIAGLGLLITSGAFVLAAPAPLAVPPTVGMGAYLAVIASIVAAIGAVVWIGVAPHLPLHPLRADISWGRLIGVGIAALTLVLGAFSAWSFDTRTDVVITPEIQAQIDELKQEAADHPEDAAVIANQIANLTNQARATAAVPTDGVSQEGAQLGIWTMVLGFLALLTTLPAVGVFGQSEHRNWVWSSVTAGLGFGITSIALAWIFTFVRRADPNFISGVGSFITLMGGVFIVASTMSVLGEFRRARVYEKLVPGGQDAAKERADQQVEELV